MTTPYLTVIESDAYFNDELFPEPWFDAANDAARKDKAIRKATEIINTLRFAGIKTLETQENEFPRTYPGTGNETDGIPEEIQNATAELARALIDGKDIESEVETLRVKKEKFSSVSTEYDTGKADDLHLRSGIVSVLAWNWLKPFLEVPSSIVWDRVS